jgi:hypothetical protein
MYRSRGDKGLTPGLESGYLSSLIEMPAASSVYNNERFMAISHRYEKMLKRFNNLPRKFP